MSEPFKPGDVVRTIVPPKVIKSIDPAHAIDRFLHFEDGTIGRPQNYELVEPSVPVSKIREVCEGLMLQTVCNDHDNGFNAALDAVMAHLIDEDQP